MIGLIRTHHHFLRLLAAAGVGVAILPACQSGSGSPLFDYRLSHVTSTFGRGGRAVAVDVDPVNLDVAIAGSEQGGLYRTGDGGTTWTHLDGLPVPGIADARFVPGDSSGRTLVVTGAADSRVRSDGGVWVSGDGGASWSHAVLPSPCGVRVDGLGIGFDPLGPDVLVGTSCGLVISHDVATRGPAAAWSMAFPFSTIAVAEEQGTRRIDACSDGPSGRGLYAGAATGGFALVSPLPDCQSVHSIAVSPAGVCSMPGCLPIATFATMGGTVIQSIDGGGHWTDLKASPFNDGRPIWVRTNPIAFGLGSGTFGLYAPGQVESCTFGLPQVPQPHQTWICPQGGWQYVPASSLNHDLNDIAFSHWLPLGNCPQYMALDFGVVRADPPNATTCTNGSGWQISGNDAAGFHALQIYGVAGQLDRVIGSSGRVVSANTNLYIATQDNHAQYSPDGGVSWQDVEANDNWYPQSPLFTVQGDPNRSGVTMVTCCNSQPPYDIVYKRQQMGAALGTASSWPLSGGGCGPPPTLGGDIPPTLVAAGKYVEWSKDGTTLLLSVDDGCTWRPAAVLPPGITGPYWMMQVSGASTGNATLYGLVNANGTPQTLVRITGFENASGGSLGTAVPLVGSTQPVLNFFCLSGSVCPTPYGVDPANANHVIAANFATNKMVETSDGGNTWRPDDRLTPLVTENGALGFRTPDSQVRAIAFDPLHPNLVLVGTEQAGVIASNDGGSTWVTIPQSDKLTNVTSFFFDDLHGVVYVGTYGSGLWRFNWTNLIS